MQLSLVRKRFGKNKVMVWGFVFQRGSAHPAYITLQNSMVLKMRNSNYILIIQNKSSFYKTIFQQNKISSKTNLYNFFFQFFQNEPVASWKSGCFFIPMLSRMRLQVSRTYNFSGMNFLTIFKKDGFCRFLK